MWKGVGMHVLGVAGLPGSGKSRLMRKFSLIGYDCYDDVNTDWETNLTQARKKAKQGIRVAASDILFCDILWRKSFENEIGGDVEWIFMANKPWRCIKNCFVRFVFEDCSRPLRNEVKNIRSLSAIYTPIGICKDVRGAGILFKSAAAVKGSLF
jgi:hypothetical protein